MSSVIRVSEVTAPRNIDRYNLYSCADFTIMPAEGYSSGQVIAKVQELARELPIAILGALAGVKFMGISTSVYTQLGMLLLVGLATKNAILIIEFAKEERDVKGASIRASAEEVARERFRSVLMTAFTCVLGTAPMLFASGAGAVSRVHVGTVMFFGMTVATVLGVFLIPGLFVMMQTFREGVKAMLGMGVRSDDDDEDDDWACGAVCVGVEQCWFWGCEVV